MHTKIITDTYIHIYMCTNIHTCINTLVLAHLHTLKTPKQHKMTSAGQETQVYTVAISPIQWQTEQTRLNIFHGWAHQLNALRSDVSLMSCGKWYNNHTCQNTCPYCPTSSVPVGETQPNKQIPFQKAETGNEESCPARSSLSPLPTPPSR